MYLFADNSTELLLALRFSQVYMAQLWLTLAEYICMAFSVGGPQSDKSLIYIWYMECLICDSSVTLKSHINCIEKIRTVKVFRT
jgi:hypothetical protein